MFRLSKVRVGLVAVALFGLAGFAAAEDDKGKIKSVFADKNEIVLKGVVKDATYDVNKETRMMLDGKNAKLADLKEGDTVNVRYTKSGERMIASEVRALRSATEENGTVKSVNSETDHITLKGVVKDGVYHLEKDATIWVDAKPAKLADLRDGDVVRITYIQRGDVRMAIDVTQTKKRN